MAIEVVVDIVPEWIDAGEWAKVFDKTLVVLESGSTKLMGLDWRVICGVKLPVYTRSIRRGVGGTFAEQWYVGGDRAGGRQGQSTTMVRDFAHYVRLTRPSLNVAEDIVGYAAEGGSGRGSVRVFGDMIYGETCQAAILAAAMMIENAFPQHAMVGGQFCWADVERARQFAERSVGHSVAPPVRVDIERLLRRLRSFYQSDELVNVFDKLYLDEPIRKLEVLFRLFPISDVESYYLSKLRQYSNPDVLGVWRMVIAYLNATGDLARLCEIGCLDACGPGYDPDAFVSMLANLWVGVPRQTTAFLDGWPRSIGQGDDVPHLFGGLLLDLEAQGRHLVRRFEYALVRTAFARVFGANASRLAVAFRQQTALAEANLTAPRACMPAFVDRVQQHSLDAMSTLPTELSARQRGYLDDLVCCIQALRQKLVIQDPTLSSWLYGEAKTTRRRLVESLSREGPILTEDAWDWILHEEDLEVLHFLVTMAMVKDADSDFYRVQRVLFEDATLCRSIVKASGDNEACRSGSLSINQTGIPDNTQPILESV